MAWKRTEPAEGRFITTPDREEMAQKGALDGAAHREGGLSAALRDGTGPATMEISSIPVLVDFHHALSEQAAAMTLERHHEGVATANADVVAQTSELAAAQTTRARADNEVDQIEDAKGRFEEHVQTSADPDLHPPADAGLSVVDDSAPADGSDVGKEPATERHAWRFPLRRDLPESVAVVVLLLITGAEFALNARAFQSVREAQWLVLLLAGLVGVGMVALAHRIGSNARDLLENPPGASGRSPSKLVEMAVEIPALALGITGVATIRSSYFTIVHIRIPTAGLVLLQAALAVAAIATTMAARNQANDQMQDFKEDLEQAKHEQKKAGAEVVKAESSLARSEGALRTCLQHLVDDYYIQTREVTLATAEYVRAYANAAGVILEGALPEPAMPDLITQAEAWLAEHPLGTAAHTTLPHSHAGDEGAMITAIDGSVPGREAAA